MPVRTARAEWKGDLAGGEGTVRTESGALEARYTAGQRFGDDPGSNPEELIGAAHAGCFAMAFANILAEAGFTPERVEATARVHLEIGEEGASISRIDLRCSGKVDGIDEAVFLEKAEQAKEGCPVSRALRAVPIELEAALES